MSTAPMPMINASGQNSVTLPNGPAPASTMVGGPVGTSPGGPGNMGFGNSGNPQPTNSMTNPYNVDIPGGLPGVSMNPGAGTAGTTGLPTGPVMGDSGQTIQTPNTFDQTGRQQGRTLKELQTIYGEGMGSMMYQYLQSGGGYNSDLTKQAVDSQTAAMQHQIQEGGQNIMSMLGAEGISPNSSAAALEIGDFYSQATANENAIASQDYLSMWNDSQNREASMLGTTGKANETYTANQPGVMDYLNMGMQIAGDVGGAMVGLPGIGGSIGGVLGGL